MHFPRSLGLGFAWLPKPLLRLALDFTYDEWTQVPARAGTPGSPDRPVSGFDGLPPDLSATRNTVTVNAGLEKLFPVKGQFVPLRLGFTYEPQGARDPLVRDDFDHVILAAGTGINSNSVKFDVALEYRWGAFRNTRNLSPAYLVGRDQEFCLPPRPEAEGSDARPGMAPEGVADLSRHQPREGQGRVQEGLRLLIRGGESWQPLEWAPW